jgi:hypothetical protein
LKGRDAAKDIESARKRFDFNCDLHPSMTAHDSVIVDISDVTKRAKAKLR